MVGEAIGIAGRPVVAQDTSARLGMLFDRHHQRLYRLARRLVPTADDARDLVQDTFLRVAQSPTVVPDGATAEEAWLVRILVNICRDRWRTRARRIRLHTRLPEPSVAATIESALAARQIVWGALETLPPRRRAILVLYELEDVAIPDIARLLNISAVTVRWHLSRGRRELAAALKRKGSS